MSTPTQSPESVCEKYPGSDYTADEVEFLKAMTRYQADHHRKFPTFCECLDVAKSLGYRRVMPPSEGY